MIFNKFKASELICVVIASCIGSMTNTIGCLGMLYILYLGKLVQVLGNNVAAVLFSIIGTAGIAEMSVTAIITTAAILRIKKLLLR